MICGLPLGQSCFSVGLLAHSGSGHLLQRPLALTPLTRYLRLTGGTLSWTMSWKMKTAKTSSSLCFYLWAWSHVSSISLYGKRVCLLPRSNRVLTLSSITASTFSSSCAITTSLFYESKCPTTCPAMGPPRTQTNANTPHHPPPHPRRPRNLHLVYLLRTARL